MAETEDTHAMGILDRDFRKEVGAQTPPGRIGQPHDIAPAVAFLAFSDASWLTGETIYIGGGLR
jgi:3-oxoacyl-[acyl-carrier protein] reductase